MDINNGSDKRQYLRYEVLDYALVYSDAYDEPIRSVVVDIGLGGLQVRARQFLELGSIVLLKIGNMEHPPVTIRGEVRYNQGLPGSDLYSLGIRFMPESHEERTEVAEYVHSVFQRQADLLIS